MAREDAQMKIRLPAELQEEIRQVAEANQRSINGEVVHALRIYMSIERKHLMARAKIAKDLAERGPNVSKWKKDGAK